MRRLMVAAMAAAAVVLSFGFVASHAFAADDPPAKSDAAKADAKKDADKKSDIDLPPFPEAASVKQVTHVAGKTLNYTATVGALPVRDEKGKKIAEVVVTSTTSSTARAIPTGR